MVSSSLEWVLPLLQGGAKVEGDGACSLSRAQGLTQSGRPRNIGSENWPRALCESCIPSHAGGGCATQDVPSASTHPTPGAKIRTHSAISNGTRESFHVQFPHQIHRHVSKAIIPLPNGLCSGIVSRTFLHALGIPDSLKLPFLVTTACLVLSKTLTAPSPGLCLSHNRRELQ